MKSKLSIFFTGAILLLALSLVSFSSDNWRNLGSKTVNYRLDRDVLNVQVRDGLFRQLKFEVENGSLNMHKVEVHFRNGGKQEIALRYRFDSNSSSRVIDLRGKLRLIEKIVFWYESQNSPEGRAKLTVWGR